MARINTKTAMSQRAGRTHEGGVAVPSTNFGKLRRSVLSCLLWEGSFYEDGMTIANRIMSLVPLCKPDDVAELAREARHIHKLRHAPLLLALGLVLHPHRHDAQPGNEAFRVVRDVINRPDELTEIVSIYWAINGNMRNGKGAPLPKQLRRGLRQAFLKFDEYQMAKWDRNNDVRLRDVAFLCHVRGRDIEARLVNREFLPEHTKSSHFPVRETFGDVEPKLATPDTWEVGLSAGQDKAATFRALMESNKLGGIATVMNLRNMHQAGMSRDEVQPYLFRKAQHAPILPFRYVAAARAVPEWEAMCDTAMQLSLANMEKMPGKTVLLVDVSGSMNSLLSSRSEMRRCDAAGALAALARGICHDVHIYAFGEKLYTIPPRHGMALVDQLKAKSEGTYLGRAVSELVIKHRDADRLIVFTDEQAHDYVRDCGNMRGYMVNVSVHERGVGYGKWVRINGFSEAVIDYIRELEYSHI